MTLAELLAAEPPCDLGPPRDREPNLDWLQERLAAGFEPVAATRVEVQSSGDRNAGLLLLLERAGQQDEIPVYLGPRTRAFLLDRLPDVPVGEPARPGRAPAAPAESPALSQVLATLLARDDAEPVESRAAALADWIMDRIGASRCALVPFVGGTPGAPLAFHVRGGGQDEQDLRRLPRRVLAHVALTRQPRIRHQVGDPDAQIEETAAQLRVQSYMAVPVLFRGDLLAVCYADRFDSPRTFDTEEQRVFEAFSYELARPLLRLLDARRRQEFLALRDSLLRHETWPRLRTSAALAPVLERAERLARHVTENLIVLGETGVGKEVVARFIHERSGRATHPFAAVNVSAIPSDLLESELFGSVRGAFTGAVDNPGRIAEAAGGTLFLDEIGDLALVNQVKLLRFLADRRLRPVGGRGERPIDVRVVAATNRPLERMVQTGEFREDLFHRFAPPLHVPPLRERVEEILPHARDWLVLKARQAGLAAPQLSADAEAFLAEYPWPGNVRQLETVLTHALLIAPGPRIGRPLVESLVPREPASSAVLPGTLPEWTAWRDDHERRWLAALLDRHAGNVATAARQARCARSTLRSLLQKHHLIPSRSDRDGG